MADRLAHQKYYYYELLAYQMGQTLQCLAEYNGLIYGGKTNGQLLEYDSTNHRWIEKTPTGAYIINRLIEYNAKLYAGLIQGYS